SIRPSPSQRPRTSSLKRRLRPPGNRGSTFPSRSSTAPTSRRGAGGNPSWNSGVDYGRLLLTAPGRDEVAALYSLAGLDVNADIRALDAGATIKADPAAASYLNRYITFDGNLSVPMLSMHTTGDGLVIPPNESAYGQVVGGAGRQDMLRQVFVHRAG